MEDGGKEGKGPWREEAETIETKRGNTETCQQEDAKQLKWPSPSLACPQKKVAAMF